MRLMERQADSACRTRSPNGAVIGWIVNDDGVYRKIRRTHSMRLAWADVMIRRDPGKAQKAQSQFVTDETLISDLAEVLPDGWQVVR